jgi:O-antigen/teichoic acid export membrane protein
MHWSLALFALVLVPSVVGCLFGGDAITSLFGSGWKEAADYVGWLGLWAAMLVVNAPATVALRIARKQRQVTVYNMIVLIVRTIAIVVGAITLGDELTVAGFALLGVLLNFGLILYALRLLSRKHDRA